ncbi:MAG: WbuC family cupin fold metalloprotein [Bacteroidota bacterium]
MSHSFPLAMQPPSTSITTITQEKIAEAIVISRQSPRKRIILPYHKSAADKMHRMFNIIQPYSYIRPHTHITAFKHESIILLQGAVCFFVFDTLGNVTQQHTLRAGSWQFGIDIEPHIVHSFIALEEDTVLFEVKPGPYDKALDKDFMPWSPEEGTPEATAYLDRLYAIAKS